MMGLINEAYSRIAHAPLRYHIAGYPRIEQQRTQSPYPESKHARPEQSMLPMTDLGEFVVRFVCGGLLGAWVSATLVEDLSKYPDVQVAIRVALIASCSLAAARFGDRFWSWLLENWLSW